MKGFPRMMPILKKKKKTTKEVVRVISQMIITEYKPVGALWLKEG